MILYRIQSIPWSSYKIYDNQKEKICSWKYWKFYFRFECIPSKYVKISLIFWDFLKGLYTRYRRSLGWRWITTGARWYPAITMSSRSFSSARVQYNWWRCLQWWRWGFWSVWGGWRQFCSTCLRSYGLTFFCRQKNVGDNQNLIRKQTSFLYGIKISMKKHENLRLDFTLIGILMSIEKIEFELNSKNLLVIHAFKWLK